MSVRKVFSRLLLLVVILIAALAWQNRVALQAFPSIISAYTAKEYCSCRYVMDNPAEYCMGYVKQWVPGTLSDDATHKRVTANGMGRTSSAVWKSQRQGCQLGDRHL
ncbi:MAG: amidase [Pseudomonas sp.]|nr:amidase [Pseudomonas sp.]